MEQSPRLLDDRALDRSSVVANSAMNRERGLAGPNSYHRELRFDVLAFLRSRLEQHGSASWLDLCCGSGRALVEAANQLQSTGSEQKLAIHGVDLTPFFQPTTQGVLCVELQAASLNTWQPTRAYDLITCVHGLYYIGDKLGLIHRAVSWLEPDGLFLAHLDSENLCFAGGEPAGRRIIRDLRAAGLSYAPRTRLLRCCGHESLSLRYAYLGADDQAGSNYTGQPAVNSYYSPATGSGTGCSSSSQ